MTNKEINAAYIGSEQVDKIYLGDALVYGGESPTPVANDYFTITNNTANAGTITLTASGDVPTIVLKTSTDGTNWTDNTISATTTFTLPANGYVKFDGSANEAFSDTFNYYSFSADVSHDVSGDVLTLVSGDTLSGREFRGLFSGDTQVVNASGLTLSSTTLELEYESYAYMFRGCTSLTSAPELPATTVGDSCYYYMFADCTSLTSAPALPATTLFMNCYYYMFKGCTSLTSAPELPATTLVPYCYSNMFRGCTGLTSAPELPATTLASNCYTSMFNGCTSLTTAPALPATTLKSNCYSNMFSGCTSLTSITCLATNISARYCTSNWVKDITTTGTFYCDPSMTSTWTQGNNGYPTTWTIQAAT